MMHFHVRPFRRLQWQLSLSYTLVAAGALLVVELLLISIGLILINTDALPNLLVRAFRTQFSVSLRNYLDQPTPDYAGVRDYLSAYSQTNSGGPGGNGPEQPNRYSVLTTAETTQNLIVLDPAGTLIWAQYPIPGTVAGYAFDTRRFPGLDKVLPAAWANDRNEAHLWTRSGDSLIMAIPIESADGQRVLSVLAFQLQMPSFTNRTFMLQLLPVVLASLLIFTFGAGAVGTVFGFFTARELTRRLERISTAADAWSRGDFSEFIHEPPNRAGDDELGELARRLNAMAEQLQNLLATRQELAALKERNRIARELHDSVKQQVFATAMQVGAARALLPEDNGPVAERLAEAEKLTRQAQNELTALIHELRPAALAGKGLIGALRDLVADWARQSGIQARFDCPSPTPSNLALSTTQEQAVFRVAQEALANIARHSGARTVQVCLSHPKNEVRLSIADDGQGFDPHQAEGAGVGLGSMRERIQAVGGRVEIESAPGKGTQVTILLATEPPESQQSRSSGSTGN